MTDQTKPNDAKHRGDYAEGQETEHHSTVDDLRGDFAEGQESTPRRGPTDLRRGDFAEGQEEEHHQGGAMGDFARGQEGDDRK